MQITRGNLKEIDRQIRLERGGITFFVEIRGKTPFDRIALISVPMDEDNISVLRTKNEVKKALSDFARKMKAPLMFFRFYEGLNKYIVRFIIGGKEVRETTVKAFAEGVKIPSVRLLLEKSKEANGLPSLPPAHSSAFLYSDMHNRELPNWSWCVDIDCFNENGIVEIKRKGEKLTYNQRVLRDLVRAKGIGYEVLYV